MNRTISPTIDDLRSLPTPLTRGEQAVLEFFNSHLKLEWEIYIQPHLNGLRPDFVLLHPRAGIAVFEVKDWDLDAVRYFIEPDSRHLFGERDGKTFCRESENPFTKVRYYGKAIFDLYCPRLGPDREAFGAITAGVVFPFADKTRLQEIFAPLVPDGASEKAAKYRPLSGAADLNGGHIERVFPDHSRTSSKWMRPELADDLRGWLREPEFSKVQRRPLELDSNQRSLASTRTESGYRRIKGPAGSGKSLVLAARAASLADEGKSVLVATFNITLWHYLRDLVMRALRQRQSHRNIVFNNFHNWCKDVCHQVGWSERYDKLWVERDYERVLSHGLARLTAAAATLEKAPKYDAILVDEGQDYQPGWWDALRQFLKPDGEMWMVADATQDIYGTARAWTDDAMTGAGFRGNWNRLEASYRLPPKAVPLMRDFAERFLDREIVDLPEPLQSSLDLSVCRLRWVQCTSEQLVGTCVDELTRMLRLMAKDNGAYVDLTFLCADVESGQSIVDQLARLKISCVSTFAEDEQDRRREKLGLYMGDARVKATTLHSFKGWESPYLLIHIGHFDGPETASLIYTGLTRLKAASKGCRLTVVCSAPELADWGRSWPNFVETVAPSSPAACIEIG